MSEGQESVPKHECAACESGQSANVFAPYKDSVWR